MTQQKIAPIEKGPEAVAKWIVLHRQNNWVLELNKLDGALKEKVEPLLKRFAPRVIKASVAVRAIRIAADIAPEEGEKKLLFAKFERAVMDIAHIRQMKDGAGKWNVGEVNNIGAAGFLSALIYLSSPRIDDIERLGLETQWAINKLRTHEVFA